MNTDYKKILSCINYLNEIQVLDSLSTNCQVASDILQSMLVSQNIESEIVETVAILSHDDGDSSNFVLVGFDNKNINENQVDSHFVVITKTSTPYLIDISISNLLPKNSKFIITEIPINRQNKKIISIQCENVTVSYFDKNIPRDIASYSASLTQRILTELKLKKSYKFLTKIVILACILGLINFTLNIALLILKLLNP